MRKADRFWDRIAERYAKKPVPDEAVYQAKRNGRNCTVMGAPRRSA